MGFEPMEHICPSDFKTDALSHSATLPYGAGDGTRTRNLLITNQLLCQLSYTSLKFFLILDLVPRGGIEPPTQGFSVPCSTD